MLLLTVNVYVIVLFIAVAILGGIESE